MEQAYAATEKNIQISSLSKLRYIPRRETELLALKDAAYKYYSKSMGNFEGVSRAMENTFTAIERKTRAGENLDGDGLVMLCRQEALKVQAPEIINSAVGLAKGAGTLKKGITQKDVEMATKKVFGLIDQGRIFDEEGICLYIGNVMIKPRTAGF